MKRCGWCSHRVHFKVPDILCLALLAALSKAVAMKLCNLRPRHTYANSAGNRGGAGRHGAGAVWVGEPWTVTGRRSTQLLLT
jgi:hypothetical protein